jgi:integrase
MSKVDTERTLVGLRVTIYPRGKKRIYVADFHFDGRHCRMSLSTTNKKTATEKAIAIEHDLMNGCFNLENRQKEQKMPEPQISIETVSRDYVAYLKTEGRRRKTVVKYEGILRVFTKFANENGVSEIGKIDLLLVDRYRTYRQPHLSDKSMFHKGSLLKRFLSWCVERQLLARNPLADRTFRPPKAKPRGGPALAQIDSILAASTKVRRPIIAVAAFAGLRIGEISRLRVVDVDFTNNWIHVVSRPGYETKSGDSWKVPLHPRLRKILEHLPRAGTGWFFSAQPSCKYPQGDHHINPKHANEDFAKVLKQQGIASGRDAGFTFHSLRASFKTICINSGIPKEVVDTWQNHGPDRAASHVYKLTDDESQRFIRLTQFGDE